MRLREAYETCKREEKKVREYEKVISDYYYTLDINGEKHFIKYIKKCQDFYRYAKYNFGSIPYIAEILKDAGKEIDEAENGSEIFYSICEVCQRIYCIISMYDISENHNDQYIGLDIKIPKIDNITELKKFIDGLEFVFTKCPFFQNDKESLKLQSVDNGSIWFIFGIVGVSVGLGSVLLNNIAAFMDKCFVIKSHKYTCEMQKLHIDNEKMEQKEKEELLKSINKVYKISVKTAIKDLETSTGYKIQDGEEMGRVEQSFDKMIKMLDQGLQIHSAINSSEEVKALFEPLEMHYLSIESGLEQIEEKNDTDSE